MTGRILSFVVAAVLLAVPTLLVLRWQGAAAGRLEEAEAEPDQASPAVAIAQASNETYCTPQLKRILRRVLQSCGLLGGAGRGCQPLEARQVATMDDADFNALFVPMKERGGIVQFDRGSATLDPDDMTLVNRSFADRKGASYFFVVARASPDGPVSVNRDLSQARAEALLEHLRTTFADDELERQVGLLWLGEEYAQLDASFCQWSRSGSQDACRPEDLNRSAFIAWIDCRL